MFLIPAVAVIFTIPLSDKSLSLLHPTAESRRAQSDAPMKKLFIFIVFLFLALFILLVPPSVITRTVILGISTAIGTGIKDSTLHVHLHHKDCGFYIRFRRS